MLEFSIYLSEWWLYRYAHFLIIYQAKHVYFAHVVVCRKDFNKLILFKIYLAFL